jgi:hypothetical protein
LDLYISRGPGWRTYVVILLFEWKICERIFYETKKLIWMAGSLFSVMEYLSEDLILFLHLKIIINLASPTILNIFVLSLFFRLNLSFSWVRGYLTFI